MVLYHQDDVIFVEERGTDGLIAFIWEEDVIIMENRGAYQDIVIGGLSLHKVIGNRPRVSNN
jgi:hypothetical protein